MSLSLLLIALFFKKKQKRKLGPNLASKEAKKPKKAKKKDPWESSSEEDNADDGSDNDDDGKDGGRDDGKAMDKSEETDMNALFDAAKKITPPGNSMTMSFDLERVKRSHVCLPVLV